MGQRAVYRAAAAVGTVTALALVAGCLLWTAPAGIAASRFDHRPTCRGKVATLVGTPGNDDIVGTAKADVIVGRSGTDKIDGGAGNDIICGGRSGIRVEEGENVPQSLFGGPGDDVIVGGPQRDELSDLDGVDLLLGRGGGDFLSVDDTAHGRDDDFLRGGPGPDQLWSYRGDDGIYGGKGEDLLQDGSGDNLLRGGAGNDRFQSGPGNDAVHGGPGIDLGDYLSVLGDLSASGHCNDVTADLGSGVASGEGFGVDSLEGVENLAGGGGEDVLIGDSDNNTFYVGRLCRGDVAQQDSVSGGDGWDRIVFDSNLWDGGSSVGPVAVDLAAGTAELPIPDGPLDTVLTVGLDSVENVTGTEYADRIAGDGGPNLLSAGPPGYSDGGDVMWGRGGNDNVIGSEGADTIYGDEGADKLRGLAGNDRLDGGADINTIDGGRGKDFCQNPDRYNGAVSCEA